MNDRASSSPRLRVFERRSLDRISRIEGVPDDERDVMRAVSAVLPFRVNQYVLDELIDWSRVPDDPIYQLTFPQRDMLAPADLETMLRLVRSKAPEADIKAAAREIQLGLNPHPAGQVELNSVQLGDQGLGGIQHKYRETVLFFPSQGQTCHAYCSYCFRWPQFVGLDDIKFAATESATLVEYLRGQPAVTNVLFTGGDPMVMRTAVLERYVQPLLDADLRHVDAIRFGTKAPAYWPQRFVTDPDADDLLRLFERVVASGKHLALMAHISHPRELETPTAQAALSRILGTGAVVRCQAPLARRVNDDANTWADMWKLQVRLGAMPYYMFIARDTGPRDYFEVPLARALDIYQGAMQRVSGLARTARGPSMSTTWGKVTIDGVVDVADERAFVLRFLQARDPSWCGHPFFARHDENATWLDHLEPALGESRFCFSADDDAMSMDRASGVDPVESVFDDGEAA